MSKEIENAETNSAEGVILTAGAFTQLHGSNIDNHQADTDLLALLQEALPVERRGEVAYHQLKIGECYAISPVCP